MVQSEEIRKEFVSRLKQSLAKSGIAEWGAGSRLAEITGKTPKAASKWLNGEAMPGRANMQAIADELHVSIQWLQYGEGQMLAGGASYESNLEPSQVTLIADNPKEAAAAAVMEMLQKHKGGLSAAAQQQIADAVAGSLAEQEVPATQQSNVIAANFSRAARILDGDILIPQYDVRAAMGNGQVPADYVEFVRNIIVSGPQLEKMGLDYTSPANLSVITGWGQSMEGTINDKDPVVVDRGVNEFVGDGVYVITWLDLLYIKRLQMHDAEHFKLISDNKQLDRQVARIADVTIHAKVLLVWNARKL